MVCSICEGRNWITEFCVKHVEQTLYQASVIRISGADGGHVRDVDLFGFFTERYFKSDLKRPCLTLQQSGLAVSLISARPWAAYSKLHLIRSTGKPEEPHLPRNHIHLIHRECNGLIVAPDVLQMLSPCSISRQAKRHIRKLLITQSMPDKAFNQLLDSP